MSFEVKRDGNVGFIGPQSRFSVLGLNPSNIAMKMKDDRGFSSKQPQDENGVNLNPAISAGLASYDGLHEGGWFKMLSDLKRPIEVLSVTTCAGVSLEVHNTNDLLVEAMGGEASVSVKDVTGAAPFFLAAGESLVASGGSGAHISITCKLAMDNTL